jgi:hypothetical protein
VVGVHPGGGVAFLSSAASHLRLTYIDPIAPRPPRITPLSRDCTYSLYLYRSPLLLSPNQPKPAARSLRSSSPPDGGCVHLMSAVMSALVTSALFTDTPLRPLPSDGLQRVAPLLRVSFPVPRAASH